MHEPRWEDDALALFLWLGSAALAVGFCGLLLWAGTQWFPHDAPFIQRAAIIGGGILVGWIVVSGLASVMDRAERGQFRSQR